MGPSANYYEQRGASVLRQIKEENLDKVRYLEQPDCSASPCELKKGAVALALSEARVVVIDSGLEA
jgi:hypothetical protein